MFARQSRALWAGVALTLAGASLSSCGEAEQQLATPARSAPDAQSPREKQHSARISAEPALSIEHVWGEHIPELARPSYLSVINMGLQLAQRFPPAEDSLFNWKGDRGVLEGKSFQFHFTTSDDPIIEKLTAGYPGGRPENMDALTFEIPDLRERTVSIVTVLFVDKLFFDASGKERPDALARTIVALGHEVYGNVGAALRRDINDLSLPPTYELRRAAEVNAFSAGIAFLERLSSDKIFSALPPKIQTDLQSLLTLERRGLESWRR